jgi:hypothetical protein
VTGVTAMIVLVVFVIIYLVVNYSVIQNSDKALWQKLREHLQVPLMGKRVDFFPIK